MSTNPGGNAKALPNIPFTVDANRKSDGVSSTSPLTMTAPSMPYYTESDVYFEFGEETDMAKRREHYNELVANQKLQGVAPKGTGAPEREFAAYVRMTSNVEEEGRPNKTFTVDASERWNPSRFPIQMNEVYNVIVLPNGGVEGGEGMDQDWIDGQIRTDAGGYEAKYDAVSLCYVAGGRCRSYLKQPKRYPYARWFELICGVGNYYWKLSEAANMTRYMPLSEDEFTDTVFPVGKNFTFNATHTGELVCFANDANGLYYNNVGVLNVTVTRMSWPPLQNTSLSDLQYVGKY